jgi:hypothetical protein
MKDFGKFLYPFGLLTAILYILWPFWYIFSRFGTLYQEKSGNPVIMWQLKNVSNESDQKKFFSPIFSRSSIQSFLPTVSTAVHSEGVNNCSQEELRFRP